MGTIKKISVIFIILSLCTTCTDIDDLSLSQKDISAIITEETIMEVNCIEVDAICNEAIAIINNDLKIQFSTSDGRNFISDYPKISIDSTHTPQKMTLDFGNNNIQYDGKKRSGIITITASNFKIKNITQTFDFNSFSVEGDTLKGEVSKTITSEIDKYDHTAKIEENLMIINRNKDTLYRSSKMCRKYTFNEPTPWERDDRVYISGSAQFTNSKKETITKVISNTNNVLYRCFCRTLVSGVQNVKYKNEPVGVEYGRIGTCSKWAVIKYQNQIFATELLK